MGGIKEHGFSQVVGPAPDREKLFWLGAVRRHVRTLGRDLLFLGAVLAISSHFGVGGLLGGVTRGRRSTHEPESPFGIRPPV